MRSVPSRTSLRSQFGVTSEATKTRAAEILRAITSMENYLQFVSGAKQVLDVAALELADDGMSKEEIARVLEKGRDNLRKYDTMAMVSWNSLSNLTEGPGTGGFIGTGASAETPLAKQINDSLRTRIHTVGQQAGIYAPGTTGAGPNWSRLNAPVGAGESFLVAAQRWAAEAPKGGLLSELPAVAAPGAAAPGAAPDAMPAWLLPALAVAGAAGVALLLLPSGSSNRGSRARNLDYGSTPSDAHEGRMIRGTLRNLESDAHAMRQMLQDDDDLPQWVHSKVETSADRVNSAQRYLRAKIQALK